MKTIYSTFKNQYIYIYVALLVIIAAVMPHSRVLLSIAQIALAVVWLFEADFKRKFIILKQRKSILIFASIFFLHIIGLLYTEDFSSALKDIKIKLPLLLFPVIIGTSDSLTIKNLKIIILVLAGSLIVKTLYGIAGISAMLSTEFIDLQNISGNFSHIRFALLLNIAVFSLIYLLILNYRKESKFILLAYLLMIIWLSFFILILHSVTGWFIFIILIIFTLFRLIGLTKKGTLRSVYLILSAIILIVAGIFINTLINKFYFFEQIDSENIENYSKSENLYKHDFSKKDMENGHYVYIYICETELKEEWNKISNINYKGKDKKGQKIKYTLIRYISSKGLRKDKEGVRSLTNEDIINIENGMTNYIFENKYSLYPKLYEILWQIEKYKAGENPQGHSITQRIEFLKVGVEIIRENFWIGVGTGDHKLAYKHQYQKSGSKLSEKYQLRAHNQYLTIFITFGFIGFIWFVFAYIYPIIKEKKFKDYLFLCTYTILTLSMLNEDTLETQMGATIFAFFLSLFLFKNHNKETQNN